MGTTAGVLMAGAALLLEVRRLRVIAAFLPAARRFRVVAAFMAAVRRFRVTAAFRAADVPIVNSFGLTNLRVWLTTIGPANPANFLQGSSAYFGRGQAPLRDVRLPDPGC
jgi:hypothetical protein